MLMRPNKAETAVHGRKQKTCSSRSSQLRQKILSTDNIKQRVEIKLKTA